MGLHAQYRALVAALLLAATPAGAGCRLALALGFDISRSVSRTDYRIQKQGILDALADPVIRAAFLKPDDFVALAVFEWSGAEQQSLILDWTEVRSAADLERVSAAIAAHERETDAHATALGAALAYGHGLLARQPGCAARTLDLSGDGRSNVGPRPEDIYADTDFGDILVNGLAIGGHESDIVEYYRSVVIRGRGAFVEIARLHEEFPRAIRRKLERELTEQVMGAVPARGRHG